MLWQVGSTEIGADCPFSDLPGLDRLFMVIEGAGVELTSIDEAGARTWTARVAGRRSVPYAFRGDWTTTCRLLDGPVKVFNVITRRGKALRRASRFLAREDTSPKAAGETAIAVHLGSLDAWMLSGPARKVLCDRPHRDASPWLEYS